MCRQPKALWLRNRPDSGIGVDCVPGVNRVSIVMAGIVRAGPPGGGSAEVGPAELEFGLLGPVLVRRGDEVLGVPAGKQRALLAALLLSNAQVVSAGELIDVLWGSEPPASARASLHNYVKRLRKILGD